MFTFESLRKEYNTFIYKDYVVERKENSYRVVYHFSIPGLRYFKSSWEFPALAEADEDILNRLFFHLGMVETISYWKCACPPELVIECGELSKEQCAWWEKLYYNGLGEFMYRNGIEVSQEDLVHIQCKEAPIVPLKDNKNYSGCLVSVGGGKDSVVSLELLKDEGITTYAVNGNATTHNVIDVCDYKKGTYEARRVLDKELLELNKLGYLNGHIPFSAVVAFSSIISAYLSGNQYIETTVKDSFVNHQYSKSYEFEQDFMWYVKTMIDTPILYFSLLRPLMEIQIAMLFARSRQYHKVFRSCNAGSKQGIWCCECPKCLFVYIILLPFLSQEELVEIFGEDLLEKESLDLYFRELTGIEENKPFECVGTRKEVLVSLKDYINKGGKSLLTERYRDIILQEKDSLENLLQGWENENNLPENYRSILERSIKQ